MPENLANLRTTDICPTSALFYVSGQRRQSVEDKMKTALKRQDELYGLDFLNAENYISCTVGTYVSIDVIPGPNNFYVFSYEFVVFGRDGVVETDNRNINVKLFGLYNNSGLGYMPSMTQMENEAVKIAENMFQEFVLDWRKVH